MANYSFRGLSRSLQTYSSRNALLNHLKVKGESEFDDNVILKSNFYIRSSLLQSKNTITDDGFIIGGIVNKDMTNDEYTIEFDPNSFQSEFFPGMADFIDSNIVAGDKSSEDRLIASYWEDLRNDVFDDWGVFLFNLENIIFLYLIHKI